MELVAARSDWLDQLNQSLVGLGVDSSDLSNLGSLIDNANCYALFGGISSPTACVAQAASAVR
jgi:hypothetical protein